MIAFLQCVAESVVENGFRGLAEMVPGGGFACAIAGGVWKKYRERKKDAEIREEIHQLAQANFEEAHKAAIEAVNATAPATSTIEDRLTLELYLSQVPGTVRASLKRPDDSTGKTVPPAFVLNSAEDVLKLLPARPPRFKPNGQVPGLAGWSLVELLGAGGFGEVWLARHRTMASLCGAVKFCHGQQARDLKHESGLIDRVMSAGKHPNIVPLTNAYLEGDTPWLMYEYVPGGDIADRIHEWQLLPAPERVARATAALQELTAAVGFFHKLTTPVIHRDLKPANILFDSTTGTLRITDFGIGAVMAKAVLAEERHGTLTQTGRLASSLRGAHTPLYASPQQRDRADADPRDDVHALGVIGYQTLTGHLNQGAGPDFADDLRECGATDELIGLLGRCVAQKADRRPANATELHELLSRLTRTVHVVTAPSTKAPDTSQKVASTAPEPEAAPSRPASTAPWQASSGPYLLRSDAIAYNLDDLVSLCERHWEDAERQLMSGEFEAWLTRNGHTNLAESIRMARTSVWSAERCLIEFLMKCGPAGVQVVQRRQAAEIARREQEGKRETPSLNSMSSQSQVTSEQAVVTERPESQPTHYPRCPKCGSISNWNEKQYRCEYCGFPREQKGGSPSSPSNKSDDPGCLGAIIGGVCGLICGAIGTSLSAKMSGSNNDLVRIIAWLMSIAGWIGPFGSIIIGAMLGGAVAWAKAKK